MEHKTRTRALSWLLSLALVLGLLPGLSLTASADTIGIGTTWYVGDSIILDGKYFYIYTNDTSEKRVGTNASYTVPRPYVHNNTQSWCFESCIRVTDGTGVSNLYLLPPTGKTLSDTPTGFKILSGSGTSNDPYRFELIYTKVNVTGVTVKASTILTVGGTETLAATVQPTNATEKTVTWSSDNTSVATVDANGKVTAVAAGTANIKAIATNGTTETTDDIEATCTVTVHAHSFTYTASGATITATCPSQQAHANPYTSTLTIVAPQHTAEGDGKSASATLTGLDAFKTATGKTVAASDIKYVGRDGTSYTESATAPTGEGKYTAKITVDSATASVEFTIIGSSYTIIIPARLDVANAGWNATAGITASGQIIEGNKLTVTATSANGWVLKDGNNSVGYNLATAEGTYSSAAPASWEFSADEVNASGGKTKDMGIIVEDYTGRPGGNYTDTVTFTAKVERAVRTVTWNNNDITGRYGSSFTKDGVTVTARMIDFDDKNFARGGTFTTTLGNFTKIEVTAMQFTNMGSGWAVSSGKATWTGTASSTVSFGGSGYMDGIWGMGDGVTMVFTIEPTN